jgi:hypothetical protein
METDFEVLHTDTADWAYLERRATTEGTAEALAEIRREEGALSFNEERPSSYHGSRRT